MRRTLCWVLGLAGLVGLVLFLSLEGRGGHGQSVFRMDWPDAWLVWEDRPDGHRFEVQLFRWSVGIGVASVYALYYSARLGRRRAAPAQTIMDCSSRSRTCNRCSRSPVAVAQSLDYGKWFTASWVRAGSSQ
jgi:hypothetical protein